LKIGIITGNASHLINSPEVFTEIARVNYQDFSHIYRWIQDYEFIDLLHSGEECTFKGIVDKLRDVKPLELFFLTDSRGLWIPISVYNQTRTNNPIEFFPLILSMLQPNLFTIMTIDNEDTVSFKLKNEEPLNYYYHLLKSDEKDILQCLKNWSSYQEYYVSRDFPRNRVIILSDWIKFIELFLTPKLLTASDRSEQPTLAELVLSEIYVLLEWLKELAEYSASQIILPIQKMIEALEKVSKRYEVTSFILSEVLNRAQQINIISFIKRNLKNNSLVNLRLHFFIWGCYLGIQGVILLTHGYTQINLEEEAIGLQLASNGVDYILYGALLHLLGLDLNSFPPDLENVDWKIVPERATVRSLESEPLFRFLINSLEQDELKQVISDLKKSLGNINTEIRSSRNRSPLSHGLTPVMLRQKEIRKWETPLYKLLSHYNYLRQTFYKSLTSNLTNASKNQTDIENNLHNTLSILNTALETLDFNKMNLNLNEELDFLGFSKKLLCFSCISLSYKFQELD